jgi:hypothetical protein
MWGLDSLGILSTGPVWINSIIFYPSETDGAGHTFVLKWWDENSATVTAYDITYTITTSTDDTITSAGNFPSTWVDGYVIKCLKTTGSDTGKYGLIQTAGNDNAVVTHLSPFTAEADKVGKFDCYTTYTAIKGMQPKDTNEESKLFTFTQPLRFPNLALDSLSSGSSLLIYLV